MYRLEIALSAAALFACCGHAAGFGHCICDSVSLDGEWEMAYRPYAHETVALPEFKGVRIAGAIPGYWKACGDRPRKTLEKRAFLGVCPHSFYEDGLNILRLRKVAFDPVDADALRLVVTEAWGGGRVHVFAFDAR